MISKATTVDQYLKELPSDRKKAMVELRNIYLKTYRKVLVMGWDMV